MTVHKVNKNWLKKLAQGDDEAFKQLFESYYAPLVLFAETYIKDTEQAKDIIQDILLKLTDKKEVFLTIENLKSYLYTTVRNSCIRQLNHEKVKGKYASHVLHTSERDEKFWNKVLEEETYRYLYQSIEKLPPQTQRVYKLALDGLKNQEIADELNISIETVKTHKQTGKRLLKEHMKDLMCFLWLLGM